MCPENKRILEVLKEACKQNRFPSYDNKQGMCKYRDGEKRCAVGVFLTEEELDLLEKKNKNMSSVCDIIPYCKSLQKMGESKLCNLQSIHDDLAKESAINNSWDNEKFLHKVEKYLKRTEED